MKIVPGTLIGVLHLPPLPGSPEWGGSMSAVVDRAVADAAAYVEGGADAVIMENFGDAPFTPRSVDPEVVAAMAVTGAAVQCALPEGFPLGFNVLRNDARSALGLCASCGGSFLRCNVLSGAAATDQGIIEGDAYGLLRARAALAPEVRVLADVHVKHAQPLGGGRIEDAARDLAGRGGADAIIVSGSGTGHAADPGEVTRVKAAAGGCPVLLGSGADPVGLRDLGEVIDGAIVGTWAKEGGKFEAPVDAGRVAELRAALAVRG